MAYNGGAWRWQAFVIRLLVTEAYWKLNMNITTKSQIVLGPRAHKLIEITAVYNNALL